MSSLLSLSPSQGKKKQNRCSFNIQSITSHFFDVLNRLQIDVPDLGRDPDSGMRCGGRVRARRPGEVCRSWVAGRLAVARRPGGRRPGHIAYKSPGHRYTERCLARVTAYTLWGPVGLSEIQYHMPCMYIDTCAGWKTRALRKLRWELEGSLCGSWTAHEVPPEAVDQK